MIDGITQSLGKNLEFLSIARGITPNATLIRSLEFHIQFLHEVSCGEGSSDYKMNFERSVLWAKSETFSFTSLCVIVTI